MPKRKRFQGCHRHLIKRYCKYEPKQEDVAKDTEKEVSSARGRFMGALMEVLDPLAQSDNESDHSTDQSPSKRERQESHERSEYLTDEELKKAFRKSPPPRQSYVLKLFDRSVDLSQFRDDSPLYPICRAWMINQPKANYSDFSSTDKEPGNVKEGIDLPGPKGPPVSKIPNLTPDQVAPDKNRINLNYQGVVLPSREQLLRAHLPRWAAVKLAWQEQIQLKEARYESTQQILNSINLEYAAR